MIEIYCDNKDEMRYFKKALYHSEDCPFVLPCYRVRNDNKSTDAAVAATVFNCYKCITESIKWHVKEIDMKGGEEE